TREIAAYGGLVNRMPLYAAAFMVFTLANVGLPGTTGFIGEFLTLIGTFRVNTWVATLAATGTILSAAYALWLYRKVIFGALTKASLATIKDLDYREIVTLGPLVVLTILFGIYPKPVLDLSAASVAQLLENYDRALGAAKAAALLAHLPQAQSRPMTETVEIPALLPALPEIVLAIGAMVLLMVGAFRGEQAAKGIEGAAILLLVLTGLIVVLLPAGKLVTFGGSFIVDGFARFL